jgi:hypothetical protein
LAPAGVAGLGAGPGWGANLRPPGRLRPPVPQRPLGARRRLRSFADPRAIPALLHLPGVIGGLLRRPGLRPAHALAIAALLHHHARRAQHRHDVGVAAVLAAPDVVVAADAAPPRVAQLGDACSVGAGIGGLLPDDALALWAPALLVRLLEVRGVAADAERALRCPSPASGNPAGNRACRDAGRAAGHRPPSLAIARSLARNRRAPAPTKPPPVLTPRPLGRATPACPWCGHPAPPTPLCPRLCACETSKHSCRTIPSRLCIPR